MQQLIYFFQKFKYFLFFLFLDNSYHALSGMVEHIKDILRELKLPGLKGNWSAKWIARRSVGFYYH